MLKPLWKSLARGTRALYSRKIYITMMLILPLGCAFFFISLMEKGLPLPVPVTLVDMDRSDLSRQITRQLRANQYVDITEESESYHSALGKLRSGESFGFFYIPRGFQQKTLSGNKPTLSFYTNMSIFVPGTMSFKGFKTTAVITTAGIVKASLAQAGVTGESADDMLQPLNVQLNGLNNPWLNYSIYLNPSFLSGLISLLVMLTTAFSIGQEIKQQTSPQWLDNAGGSMLCALIGKLAPQTLIFTATGIAIEALLFKFCHYPLNNHAGHIILAMLLLVIANQALAVIFCEILPNLRLALTVCSLVGILTFSIAGFSFPVDQMYGGIGIFAYILPERYFFLIYIDQALNGIPIYFSRIYYIALLIFPLVSLLGLRRLKGRCLNPIYVP